MDDVKWIQRCSMIIADREWDNLTVEEQQEVFANRDHPWWRRTNRRIEALKRGEKITLF